MGTEEGPVWSSAQSVIDGEGLGEAPSRGTVLAGCRPMEPRPAQVLWPQHGQRAKAWGAFLPDRVGGEANILEGADDVENLLEAA